MPARQELTDFVADVLMQVEGARNKPYELITKGTGNSGFTIGRAQNDARTNDDAFETLKTMLGQPKLLGGTDDVAFKSRVLEKARMSALEYAKDKDPLTADEIRRVNSLLNHPDNRSLIDQLDRTQFGKVADEVERLIDDAQGWPQGPGAFDRDNPDPESLALAAAWANRTGGLAEMRTTLGSYPTLPWTPENVRLYVSQQRQFRSPLEDRGNGENFGNWFGQVGNAAQASTTGLGWPMNAPPAPGAFGDPRSSPSGPDAPLAPLRPRWP